MIIVWGSKTSRAAKEKTMDTVFFDMDGTLIDTEKYYNVQNLVIPLQKKRHLTLEVLAGRMCIAFLKKNMEKVFRMMKCAHIEKRSWKKCLNEMALL